MPLHPSMAQRVTNHCRQRFPPRRPLVKIGRKCSGSVPDVARQKVWKTYDPQTQSRLFRDKTRPSTRRPTSKPSNTKRRTPHEPQPPTKESTGGQHPTKRQGGHHNNIAPRRGAKQRDQTSPGGAQATAHD